MRLTTVVIVACKTWDPVVSKPLWFKATLQRELSPGVIICQPITPTVTTANHMFVGIATVRTVKQWLIQPVLGDGVLWFLMFGWGIIKKIDFIRCECLISFPSSLQQIYKTLCEYLWITNHRETGAQKLLREGKSSFSLYFKAIKFS